MTAEVSSPSPPSSTSASAASARSGKRPLQSRSRHRREEDLRPRDASTSTTPGGGGAGSAAAAARCRDCRRARGDGDRRCRDDADGGIGGIGSPETTARRWSWMREGGEEEEAEAAAASSHFGSRPPRPSTRPARRRRRRRRRASPSSSSSPTVVSAVARSLLIVAAAVVSSSCSCAPPPSASGSSSSPLSPPATGTGTRPPLANCNSAFVVPRSNPGHGCHGGPYLCRRPRPPSLLPDHHHDDGPNSRFWRYCGRRSGGWVFGFGFGGGGATSTTALCGIRGFRRWFESQFPSAITPIPPNHPGPRAATVKDSAKAATTRTSNGRRRGSPPSTNNGGDRPEHSERFDHVLIDVNQMLHTTLRRSRSDGHALTMLMKELDKIVETATPLRSLVLAVDGPPGSAKIATQRSRRFRCVARSKWRRMAREYRVRHGGVAAASLDDRRRRGRRRRNLDDDEEEDEEEEEEDADEDVDVTTLRITPGTPFMDGVTSALLYWAWQRFANPHSVLRKSDVRVYVGTSDMPGEGEVKLIDWINLNSSPNGGTGRHHQLHHRHHRPRIRRGDSIAIWGGDSDLVLEGLVLDPLRITPNVFVVVPGEKKKKGRGGGGDHCVSLWEVTRVLCRLLPPPPPPPPLQPDAEDEDDEVRLRRLGLRQWRHASCLRRDLAFVLMVAGGNDYLPGLRGCSGFEAAFGTYLRVVGGRLREMGGASSSAHPYLLRECIIDGGGDDGGRGRGDDASASTSVFELNPESALEYFSALAEDSPVAISSHGDMLPYSNSVTPLSNLHRMVDGGWLPGPCRFEVIPAGGDGAGKGGTGRGGRAGRAGHETVRLTLGSAGDRENVGASEEPEEGNNGRTKNDDDAPNPAVRVHVFEVDHREHADLRSARHRLASIALEELVGWKNGGMVVAEGEEEDGGGDGDGNSVFATSAAEFLAASNVTGPDSGYPWEIRSPVGCDVERYVAGLLWNVQTYRDGVCADYAYNYGRRLSPTAAEVADYVRGCIEGNVTVSVDRLLYDVDGDWTAPLNAGLSCLAALPVQVRHLVPEPYRALAESGAADEIYSLCMSNTTNEFDMDKFRRVCLETLVASAGEDEDVGGAYRKTSNHLSAGEGAAAGAELSDLSFVDKFGTGTKASSAASSAFRSESSYLSEAIGLTEDGDDRSSKRGRPIRTGSKYWTVLSWTRRPMDHPFAPPEPFSDRLSKLRRSRYVRASHLEATRRPKWTTVDSSGLGVNSTLSSSTSLTERHGNIRAFGVQSPSEARTIELGDRGSGDEPMKELSIHSVEYKTAYASSKTGQKGEKSEAGSIVGHSPEDRTAGVMGMTNLAPENRYNKLDGSVMQPEEVARNVEHHTALYCLQNLGEVFGIGIVFRKLPPPTDDDGGTESMQLTLDMNETSKRVYEDVRDVGWSTRPPKRRRQVVKQKLATSALSDLFGPDWTSLTLEDMKDEWESRYPELRERTMKDMSPLDRLYSLADAGTSSGRIEWRWIPSSDDDARETLQLTVEVDPGSTHIFEVERVVGDGPRKHVKQQLALDALNAICGPDSNTTSVDGLAKKAVRTEAGMRENPAPHSAERNVQNRTALECLQCLADTEFCSGTLGWEVRPSADDGADEHVMLTLDVAPDFKRTFGMDRPHGTRRQTLKQHIASEALQELIGTDWRSRTVEAMKKKRLPTM